MQYVRSWFKKKKNTKKEIRTKKEERVWKCTRVFLLNFFFYILNCFDALILKIKKNHFDVFQQEKHFKKQSQPHSQTDNNTCNIIDIKFNMVYGVSLLDKT